MGGAEGQPRHAGTSGDWAGLSSANIPLAKARQVSEAQVNGWGRGRGLFAAGGKAKSHGKGLR